MLLLYGAQHYLAYSEALSWPRNNEFLPSLIYTPERNCFPFVWPEKQSDDNLEKTPPVFLNFSTKDPLYKQESDDLRSHLSYYLSCLIYSLLCFRWILFAH